MNIVLLCAPLFPDIIEEVLSDQVVEISSSGFSEEQMHACVGFCALLSQKVDAAFLDRAPNLRVVSNYAVGYDNIDLAACKKRNVIVTNTPDVLTQATAEIAVALTFACARRVVEGDSYCRAGKFVGWGPDLLLGRELSGSRALIIGSGRIGKATGKIFEGIGMETHYLGSASTDKEIEQQLRSADVVSLHMPYRQATHHYLDRRRLEMMKPDAILINTARGAVIDEGALCDVLASGHLFSVGLDVFEEEPKISAELLSNPRTVLLPHIGSATFKARRAMARLVLNAIADVLAGREPKNRIA